MSENNRTKVPVDKLAERVRPEMIPFGSSFSYFTVTPMAEEDAKQYLEEPIAALPPAICAKLRKIEIILAPYIEKGNGRVGDCVTFERPSDPRRLYSARVDAKDATTFLFGIKDEDLADYHYTFYSAIASLMADVENGEPRESYHRTLREELAAEINGEVDDRSWHLKQALRRRQGNVRKETKPFRDYARQSFEDTLTLYLHGICCDIDVETGPRQMPSRYLRRRLELLSTIYPPPEGYSVLPDQPKKR